MATIGVYYYKSGALGATTPVWGTIVPLTWHTLSPSTAALGSFASTITTRTIALSFVSDAGSPGMLNWNAGDFVWECTIFGGNTSAVMNEVAFRRLSNDLGTVVASCSSIYGTAYTLGAGAYRSATVTWTPFSSLNPANAQLTDRLEMLFCIYSRTATVRETLQCNSTISELYDPLQLPVSSPTYTLKGNNKTNVITSKSFVSKAQAKVSKVFNSLHNVTGIITQAILDYTSNISLLSIREQVNASKSYVHTVWKGLKSDFTNNVFLITESVSKSYTKLFNIKSNIIKTTKFLYNDKSNISKLFSITSLRMTNVVKAITSKLNIQSYLTKTFNTLSSIRTTISVPVKRLLYLIKSNVSNSQTYKWNAKSYITSAIRNVFNIKSYSNITKTFIHSIRTYSNQTFRSLWNLRVNTALTLKQLYSVKSNISKSISSLNKLLSNVTKTLHSLYTTLNSILIESISDFTNNSNALSIREEVSKTTTLLNTIWKGIHTTFTDNVFLITESVSKTSSYINSIRSQINAPLLRTINMIKTNVVKVTKFYHNVLSSIVESISDFTSNTSLLSVRESLTKNLTIYNKIKGIFTKYLNEIGIYIFDSISEDGRINFSNILDESGRRINRVFSKYTINNILRILTNYAPIRYLTENGRIVFTFITEHGRIANNFIVEEGTKIIKNRYDFSKLLSIQFTNLGKLMIWLTQRNVYTIKSLTNKLFTPKTSNMKLVKLTKVSINTIKSNILKQFNFGIQTSNIGLFSEDFSSNGFTNWNGFMGGGLWSIVDSISNDNNTYSAQVIGASDNSYYYKDTESNHNSLNIRTYVKINNSPLYGNRYDMLWGAVNEGPNPSFIASLYNDNGDMKWLLYVHDSTGWNQYLSSPITFDNSVQYCIEIHTEVGSNAVSKLYVNDVEVVISDSLNTLGESNQVISIGGTIQGNPAIWFDNVVASTQYIGMLKKGYNILSRITKTSKYLFDLRSNINKTLTSKVTMLYAKVSNYLSTRYHVFQNGVAFILVVGNYSIRKYVSTIQSLIHNIKYDVSNVITELSSRLANVNSYKVSISNAREYVSILYTSIYGQLIETLTVILQIALTYNEMRFVNKKLRSLYSFYVEYIDTIESIVSRTIPIAVLNKLQSNDTTRTISVGILKRILKRRNT